MNVLLAYLWPTFGVGLLAGLVSASIGFRRRAKMSTSTAVAILLTVAAAALWHGPLGAADRFTGAVESQARQVLDYYEMTQVTARLHRAPLSRRMILSGPADDFQSSELVRMIGGLPGVASAQWSAKGGGVPLLGEAMGAGILGFLLGLLLAYLVELRRRYNAQWNW